jgi:transcriptional regulator with XRE-family HTH domain/DNA-binding XRE family transcriptional regulator
MIYGFDIKDALSFAKEKAWDNTRNVIAESELVKMEQGRQKVRPSNVRALLDAYGFGPGEITAIIQKHVLDEGKPAFAQRALLIRARHGLLQKVLAQTSPNVSEQDIRDCENGKFPRPEPFHNLAKMFHNLENNSIFYPEGIDFKAWMRDMTDTLFAEQPLSVARDLKYWHWHSGIPSGILAKATGIAATTLSEYESGSRPISVKHLKALTDQLSIPSDAPIHALVATEEAIRTKTRGKSADISLMQQAAIDRFIAHVQYFAAHRNISINVLEQQTGAENLRNPTKLYARHLIPICDTL